MNDKEYEAITAALYQALGEGAGVVIEGYGASCRVQGKSGNWYQIDVLTKQSNGLQTFRTAIECKYWNKKVTRPVVSDLVTKLEDTNLEKGVVVSKEGFTSGATALAKQRNISLVEMRVPNDADWEGKGKKITINLIEISTEIYDLEWVQPPPQSGERVEVEVLEQDVTIKEPGQESKTLEQILNNALKAKASTGNKFEVNFLAGTTMHIVGHGKIGILDAVRFKVRHQTHESKIVIDVTKAIWLLVKEIFEGRQFHIGSDGQIIEVNTPPRIAAP